MVGRKTVMLLSASMIIIPPGKAPLFKPILGPISNCMIIQELIAATSGQMPMARPLFGFLHAMEAMFAADIPFGDQPALVVDLIQHKEPPRKNGKWLMTWVTHMIAL